MTVASLPPEPEIGSIDEEPGCFFGDFSPRAPHATPSDLEKVVAPVGQLLAELHEPCAKSATVLPMELGTLESLAVDIGPSSPLSESCQPPACMDSGALVASVTLSSLGDQVDETVVMMSNSEALFGKELCDLLVDLEAVCPGYGKDIASILTGEASEDVIMKVEKSLCRRRKKHRTETFRFRFT